MDVLPKSAGIVSYIVVTVIMSIITYTVVYNLRRLKEAISWVRQGAKSSFTGQGDKTPKARRKNMQSINSTKDESAMA